MRILEILRHEAFRAKNAYKRYGLWYVVWAGLVYALNYVLVANYHMYLRKHKTFTFQGETYEYFYHRYNVTWKNERAVEVPVIKAIVQKHRGERVLEVGNVLSHYFPVEHDVLDKYEKGPGVINGDVIDFQPPEKYDLVVSISTLEHIGWDEKPREPGKILAALENLSRNVIAPGGKIVVTMPLGYNTEVDTLLSKGKMPLSNICYLKRTSLRSDEWREVKWEELGEGDIRYWSGGYCANAIVIAWAEY